MNTLSGLGKMREEADELSMGPFVSGSTEFHTFEVLVIAYTYQ